MSIRASLSPDPRQFSKRVIPQDLRVMAKGENLLDLMKSNPMTNYRFYDF